MLYNVINNAHAKALTGMATMPQYIAVQSNRNNTERFITAYGDDYNTVRDDAYFHWAVIMDYEGSYKIVSCDEINIIDN